MSTWLITDPKATRIYGTVEATNEVEAAGRTDLGQATWFWQSEPGPNDQLAVHPLFTFSRDGRWRELGVTTPGGDVLPEQVGRSVSRRFGRVRRDGTWSVYTATWFVVDYGDGYTDDRCNAVRLERQDEFVMRSDFRDGADPDVWDGDYRYVVEVESSSESEERPGQTAEAFLVALPDMAAAFDPDAEIDWDGEEFIRPFWL
jgi:hypothetical protein